MYQTDLVNAKRIWIDYGSFKKQNNTADFKEMQHLSKII